jgi:hypothetical protein
MKIAELEHAVDFTLPAPTILYRVQRRHARRGAVAVGPLRVPPRGKLFNRFDLAGDETAYFGESAETAVYETLARREAVTLAMATLVDRVLLTCRRRRRFGCWTCASTPAPGRCCSPCATTSPRG